MKSTTITPNLIQVTKLGMMNAYLVREDDGFTLIDTTMSAAKDLIAAATTAGGEIKRIVLTHGHGDHIGSVDGLRAQLGPSVPFLMPELDWKILQGEDVDFGPTGTKRGSWPTVNTRPDGFIVAGENVASLDVIATPGHTPGHVAFRDTRDNSVIAGDTFSSLGGIAVPNHVHLRFPLPYGGTCDRTSVVSAAQAVRALNPTNLALGHGRVLTNPTAAMDAAIATAQKKLA